jgi:hypothetical protein
VTELLEKAERWIEPYWNAEHLRRTRDWLLELAPQASEGMILAALTHDMERHFPGGPEFDPATMAPADEAYREAHSERSAQIVGDWLRGEGAGAALVEEVERLIRLHEIGGDPEANLVQAADSISFLETNAGLVLGWYTEGRCGAERARAQHERMYGRIQVERARVLARPYHDRALAMIDEAAGAESTGVSHRGQLPESGTRAEDRRTRRESETP